MYLIVFCVNILKRRFYYNRIMTAIKACETNEKENDCFLYT